jgi:hypothetical protein
LYKLFQQSPRFAGKARSLPKGILQPYAQTWKGLPGKNALNLLETFVNYVGKQFNNTGPGINIVTNTANAKS